MPTPTVRRTVSSPPPADIDPRWLLKAVAIVFAVALVCGYITLCVLFYLGQWQLILHPSRQPAGAAPLAGSPVRFAPDASAVPQLTGWYIPAARGSHYSQITVLLLRSGNSSLASDLPLLTALHAAGTNLLAFDYRGYGGSLGKHPTEESMQQDAELAWRYLATQRHVSPQAIVPYGIGVGASLAAHLALDHGDTPALVLDAPVGDTLPQALASPATGMLPVRLLFNQRFPLAAPIHTLTTPKLLITRGLNESSPVLLAADPKITVALPPNPPTSDFNRILNRFFDLYLPPTPVPQLQPTP